MAQPQGRCVRAARLGEQRPEARDRPSSRPRSWHRVGRLPQGIDTCCPSRLLEAPVHPDQRHEAQRRPSIRPRHSPSAALPHASTRRRGAAHGGLARQSRAPIGGRHVPTRPARRILTPRHHPVGPHPVTRRTRIPSPCHPDRSELASGVEGSHAAPPRTNGSAIPRAGPSRCTARGPAAPRSAGHVSRPAPLRPCLKPLRVVLLRHA